MDKYNWRFPKLDGGLEQGINDGGIATFKGSKLYTYLAREICQNSLDAKAEGEKTVIVEFNNLSLKKSEYPSLFALDSIFKDCRDYWEQRMEPKLERFLAEADKKLANDTIDFLVIRDFNTTGLSGAKAGRREKSKWRALTHSNGVTEKAKGSQGSYGIGKNAPFACSSFRTVFYNSYAQEDNVKAFQGVARLITHLQDGSETIGVGFYQNTETSMPIFEEDKCALRDLLNRTEYGTDVVIAGFKKSDSWKADIEKAVLSNFFVAIANGTLIIRIDGMEVNDKNLKDRIKYYADQEQKNDDKEKNITTILEFYHAFCEYDHKETGDIMENGDAILYIKKDDKYSKSIAEMRSIGMVVRTRHNNIFTRYAAVVVVQPGKLNNLLKDIEPPAHDNWDPGLIEDDVKAQDDAKKYRGKLIAWVNRTITEKCRGEESDEIDLDGMSAYLPFDEEDKSLGAESKEDITPDGDTKIDTPTATKPNIRKVSIVAKKVKGVKDDNSDPHNTGGGGSAGGSAGTEDPNGKADVTAPVAGNKSVNIPRVLRQRVTKAPAEAQYRAVFMLEEDCPKIHLALKAVGDDGKKEKINIIDCKIDRKKQKVNSEQLTLTDIKGKTPYEVFLGLEYAERMQLELLIY